jgi:hypothetical protein
MRAGTMACCCAALLSMAVSADVPRPKQNWTHYVRIGAYGLKADNAEDIIRSARQTRVFGIEVDNDVTGRYESFLEPGAKLQAIRKVAELAHRANNKAFVYIAGTECITANAEKAAHSVLKDHPEWLQRKITGEPAAFTSGAAFWISPGDEDVWISPYAKSWRKTYMERVRQIAETGIDGIYVDIPYWMTHFDGWEDSWASFDDASVAAFHGKTGLHAKKDLKLGDFQDANFRKWIDFRIETLTNFMREIRRNARAINPNIMVIPEIYPGIEEESTRVGADVYSMYEVCDAIAHEYEFGGGDHMASSRTQFDWFMYQVGMLTFRGFAQGKATWILNYSWDGDKKVDPREAMKNLAMSQIMAGANFWDAPGHSMAGSNDAATRTQIFEWLARNQKAFYLPRLPAHPVGVYFSPKSRDYDAQQYLPLYRGTVLMLLQAHQEFQVVTPRTLASFRGEKLVLPNVSILSDEEKMVLRQYAQNGWQIVIAGKDATELPSSANILRISSDPVQSYFSAAQTDFVGSAKAISKEYLGAIRVKGDVEIEAPRTVASTEAIVGGQLHVFLANFTGLGPGTSGVPTRAEGIRVRIPATAGSTLAYLPFLGENVVLHGAARGNQVEFVLPAVERGAVLWVPAKK